MEGLSTKIQNIEHTGSSTIEHFDSTILEEKLRKICKEADKTNAKHQTEFVEIAKIYFTRFFESNSINQTEIEKTPKAEDLVRLFKFFALKSYNELKIDAEKFFENRNASSDQNLQNIRKSPKIKKKSEEKYSSKTLFTGNKFKK